MEIEDEATKPTPTTSSVVPVGPKAGTRVIVGGVTMNGSETVMPLEPVALTVCNPTDAEATVIVHVNEPPGEPVLAASAVQGDGVVMYVVPSNFIVITELGVKEPPVT